MLQKVHIQIFGNALRLHSFDFFFLRFSAELRNLFLTANYCNYFRDIVALAVTEGRAFCLPFHLLNTSPKKFVVNWRRNELT